jgi:inner membrane protein
LPDVDALGLRFGIPYGSFWGHRGFLHSLTFALIAGTLLSLLIRCPIRERWRPALMLVTIVASHGVLDALTSGGLGIAFFSPFDLHRYFLPWRPIRVSPIGMSFFSHRGAAVLKNELIIVWGPALLVGILFRLFYSVKRTQSEPKDGQV